MILRKNMIIREYQRNHFCRYLRHIRVIYAQKNLWDIKRYFRYIRMRKINIAASLLIIKWHTLIMMMKEGPNLLQTTIHRNHEFLKIFNRSNNLLIMMILIILKIDFI